MLFRSPAAVLISPGPGRPEDAGRSNDAIEHFANAGVPVLGVCLGHQSIVQHFGGEIIGAAALMHGKTSLVQHDGKTLYRGLSNPFEVGRYHSLAANREKMPDDLIVTARTTDGEIMGVRHKTFALEGVQFHPESILSEHGHAMLKNFLDFKQPAQ